MSAERRVRFHSAADSEIDGAADTYDGMSLGLGDEFMAEVERAIDHITAGPHRWQQVDGRHHRFVLKRFPFNVFYRFDAAQIFVVAVAHHRRRPNYWLKR